jgi:hypothetical protein
MHALVNHAMHMGLFAPPNPSVVLDHRLAARVS